MLTIFQPAREENEDFVLITLGNKKKKACLFEFRDVKMIRGISGVVGT